MNTVVTADSPLAVDGTAGPSRPPASPGGRPAGLGRRRAALLAVLALLGSTLASTLPGAWAQAPPAYQVVVNLQNPHTSVDRRFLAQAFLKRATHWEHGETVSPVDLPADSAARRRFSEVVLGRTVGAVKSFWQQVIFSGRGVPPPELESDEEVLRHVARFPGAVGYVSGASSVRGVKVLTVR